MRLFFAAPLDDTAAECVSELQQTLRSKAPDPGIRWVGRAQLHYTLKFLREIEPERVEDCRSAALISVATSRPFALALHGVGAFPSVRSPRVLWVGATVGAQPLTQIALRLAQELVLRGFAAEERAFKPHLTVARVKGPSAERSANRLLSSFQVESVACTRVARIVLMHSHLSPKGATYTQIGAFPLGAE